MYLDAKNKFGTNEKEIPEQRNLLGKICFDGRIILKLISKKYLRGFELNFPVHGVICRSRETSRKSRKILD
jgi:hypothetical protein